MMLSAEVELIESNAESVVTGKCLKPAERMI